MLFSNNPNLSSLNTHKREKVLMHTGTHAATAKAILILFSHKEYFHQGMLTDYHVNLALSASYPAPNPYL